MEPKIILSKKYAAEGTIDIAEDIAWAVESLMDNGATDEHGFLTGELTVTVAWTPAKPN